MGLHIGNSKRFGYKAASLVAVFALVAQPIYGYVAAEVAKAAPVTVHTTNLSTWDLSQTRAKGHNELVADGLHVWTDSNDSQSKAAGYYATPGLQLNDVDETSIDFVSYSGVRPSVQLGVDRDGDGSRDGYLVYEPWAYGDGQYWATQPGFGVPAGLGYASMGTLAEYQAANPDADVLTIGYSLGSGVQGDAIISMITIADIVYTFAADTTRPEIEVHSSSPENGDYLSGVRYTREGQPDQQRNRFIFNVTDDSGIKKVAMYMHNEAGDKVDEYALTQHGTQTSQWYADVDTTQYSDGLYYISARAVDNANNVRYFNNRLDGYHVYFDNTKPAVAAELSSTLFGATSPVPEVTVTASDNLSGIDRVEYKVMQDGVNVKGYGWTEVTNDTATPAPQLRELPSGDYTLVARAFDNAGNKRSGIEVDFTVDNTGPEVDDEFVVQMRTGDKLTLSPAVTDDNDVVSYSWTVSDKKLVKHGHQKDNADDKLTIGPAPKGNYTVELTVTDGLGNTTTVTYLVTISTPGKKN